MTGAVPARWLGLVAGLAAFVVLGLGVLYAGEGGPGGPDAWVQGGVDGAGAPWRQVALGVDFLGEPVGAAALVAALVTGCLVRRRPWAAVLVVVGPGAAVVVTKVLKPLAGRTIHDGHLSYPSGHTAFLTALAFVVVLLAAAGPVAVLGAALGAGAVMGWAQVALGRTIRPMRSVAAAPRWRWCRWPRGWSAGWPAEGPAGADRPAPGRWRTAGRGAADRGA
ncbi:hypothetical protein ACFQ60_35030 [Streptomyces zhihengii]